MSSDERNPVEELAEEFAERHRRGEQPSIDEYTARYPQWASEIRELFPALLVMEKLKPAGNDATGPFGAESTQPMPVLQTKRLGEFVLVREIGRGGMGVVYEAMQESLGRRVALKVLPGGAHVNATYLERFRREARAAAKLQHANIVAVHGTFETDGVHYYAMQYIEGQGLDRVLNDLRRLRGTTSEACTIHAVSAAHGLLTGNFTIVDAGSGNKGQSAPHTAADATLVSPMLPGGFHTGVAKMGLQVAEALAYAHEQGVLHRDIKPSNLMLDARGTVWVTDFGLAKAEDNNDLTGTGDIIGTLRFMAPERFDGQSLPQSDLYSLGLTLYELLTFRPAFDEPNKGRLIDKVLHESPIPPRQVDRSIPRDLETITLKCMAREPSDRYASARELADDLQRFLSDQPIKGRRISWLERSWRWCRRNPAVVGLSLIVVALLGVLLFQLTGKPPKPPAPGSTADLALPDPGPLQNFRGRNHESIYFRVVGDLNTRGYLWGTDIYTDDSLLKSVVVHAGILRSGEEGIVKVTILPGQDSYVGSIRNGITSGSWEAFEGSYRVEATGLKGRRITPRLPAGAVVRPDPGVLSGIRANEGDVFYVEIVGQQGNSIWGTDIYSDDSPISTAVLHAGVLKPGDRGIVKLTILPGQQSYEGSTRNGIMSQSYGPWQRSYKIESLPDE
jgi:serine/threonine protein kinase